MLHWLYTYVAVYVSNVSSVSDVCCKCFICMFHMLQWLYTYDESVCFKCFICFIYLLQVFFSRCVAVAMHISCKRMFQCFTCFTRMLQHVFHVASIFISGATMFYAFWMYVSSECCIFFIWMLHKSRSSVANVDLVLTCMHVHGRVAQKRSEGRNSMRGHGCGAQHIMKQNA
jgi:hypothetical protein